MTLLESLIQIAENNCPDYEIRYGFITDIEEFLYDNITTGKPIIFIAIGPDIVNEYSEDGKALSFSHTIGILIRSKVLRQQELSFYNQYKILRDVLNGIQIETDEGNKIVQIISGENLQQKGINHAQISLTIE